VLRSKSSLALACAADAGIPLTHRDASRALTLVTGHTKDGALSLDFAALARPGATLAIYMGIHSLALLTDGLVRHGFDPTTPAALVERGGTRRRRILTGTLPELAAQAPHWSTGGPALVLIGEVVGRRTDPHPSRRDASVRAAAAARDLVHYPII
jgi:uroporphyrin-III C-methyltransferase / precorrin-2 dehydrogenase / sirohydrochlorin ferrochelatase